MNWLARFLRSSIGGKVLVALTGAALLFFVIGHLLGNLQIFLGQDALNAYAKKLHDMPAVLWVARIGLLGAVGAHIVLSMRLAIANRAARPVPYATPATVQASFASRTMVYTGPMIAAFVLYHLLHFTFGVVQSDAAHLVDSAGRHDVYSMVVRGFQSPLIALTYIVAMVLLGIHLKHGITSLFQTLGLRHPRYDRLVGTVGGGLAWGLAIGNCAIPAAVLAGVVSLPS